MVQSLSSNFLEETVTRAHTVPSAFCPGVLIPSPYSFSSDCCENQPSLEIFALTLSVWAVLWVFFFFFSFPHGGGVGWVVGGGD